MVDRVCKEFKNVIVVVNSSKLWSLAGWISMTALRQPFCAVRPGELGFEFPRKDPER